MRIAILSLYPRNAELVSGGVRAAAFYLVQGLQTIEGLDIHVIHCHSDIAADAHLSRDGATLHFLAMPHRRLVPNLMRAGDRIRRILDELKPDVAHAHVPHYAVAAVRAGYPTIYTVHGVLHREAESYRHSWFDRARFILAGYYDRQAVLRADALVAISDYVRNEYRTLRTTGWVRVDNPVSDAFFAVERQEDPNRVQFVGSITEVKDLLTLMRAVERASRQWPALRVHLAGRVTSAPYASQVHEFVRSHGLAEIVQFDGMLSRDDLLDAYSRSALVTLSSRQENAPLAIIEAMAAGIPVVATRVGGVPDLVTENETGYLVAAGDDRALAGRILELLADADLRRRFGLEAREQAERRFQAKAVASRYLMLYQQLVDRT